MIKFWKDKYPGSYQSLLVDISEERKSRKNEFGSSSGGMRYLASVPETILNMIKKVYPDEPIDKKFFRRFARRYDEFRVAERV
jgi:hypothetical protein